MDKKGFIAFNELIWIVRIIFVLMTFVAVLVVVFFIINITFSIEKQELELFTHHLLYAPGGISAVDSFTGRIQPGVIDIERLNRGEWVDSIDFGKDYIAAKIIITTSTDDITTVYYNEERYNDWKPLTDREGRGSVVDVAKTLPARVDESKMKGNDAEPRIVPAKLEIHALMRKK